MNNYTAYEQGWLAGFFNKDKRSNPYESSSLILDWLEGYGKGKEARNDARRN